MSGPELILRPDRGKKAYRLRCRFKVGAYPSERALERAKYEAAERFVRDMAKQGWEYRDEHGFKMTGPFPTVPLLGLPKASEQAVWHRPSREIIAAVAAGARFRAEDGQEYVSDVPAVAETDSWEYELAAVFVRETLLVEYPDPHEEKEGLRHD